MKEKEGLQKKVKHALAMNLLDAKQNGNLMLQQQINDKIATQIEEIDRKFSAATNNLVQSYDEHMKKIIPKPKLLPIRVSVTIESKLGYRIENINVKPYDNVNDLLKQIEEFQVKRGDPIMNWNKEKLQIMVTGPLRADNQFLEQSQVLSYDHMEVDIDKQSMSQQIIVHDMTIPFSKFNIAPGSIITIMGGPVEFDSDKPLECMTLCFDKDPNATFNYFSCKTCNTNCN